VLHGSAVGAWDPPFVKSFGKAVARLTELLATLLEFADLRELAEEAPGSFVSQVAQG